MAVLLVIVLWGLKFMRTFSRNLLANSCLSIIWHWHFDLKSAASFTRDMGKLSSIFGRTFHFRVNVNIGHTGIICDVASYRHYHIWPWPDLHTWPWLDLSFWPWRDLDISPLYFYNIQLVVVLQCSLLQMLPHNSIVFTCCKVLRCLELTVVSNFRTHSAIILVFSKNHRCVYGHYLYLSKILSEKLSDISSKLCIRWCVSEVFGNVLFILLRCFNLVCQTCWFNLF